MSPPAGAVFLPVLDLHRGREETSVYVGSVLAGPVRIRWYPSNAFRRFDVLVRFPRPDKNTRLVAADDPLR